MLSLLINNSVTEAKVGTSILEACRSIGIKVPRFCYHETLSIAGNCRMCLVEVEGLDKAVASCLTEVSEGMVVFTESLFAKKARESVLEQLLLNHPLDCPICDQAGECDLQDQAKKYGTGNSKYYVSKRGVEDKYFGPLIKTIMTRCIHCTRCVRFCSEVAGVEFLGTFNRGGLTEIGSYVPKFFNSEISGNVIDLCPVGALTSKPFKFKGRPWEMRMCESVDMTDSLGANIYVNFKGRRIFRILPKSNVDLNDQIITDKARFSYDGNHKNRLPKIFIKKPNLKKQKPVKWAKFFHLEQKEKMFNKNLHLVVNPNIGFETLYALSSQKYSSKKFSVSCIKSEIETENFYLWNFLDKANDIKTSSMGLIYSLNPKIESALLNTKLRVRLQNSLLTLYSLTSYYSSNIKVRFLNLNLIKSVGVFEGRFFDLSKNYLGSVSPLLLTSNFFAKRGMSLIALFSFLKYIFKSIKVIKINETINTETIEFLNIKNISKKKMAPINKQILLNVEDNFSLRQKFSSVKQILMSLNSHLNGLASRTRVMLPALSHFEEERILLNLEQRPIKTSKAYSSFYEARSTKNTVNCLLNLQTKGGQKHYSFLYKFLINPKLFDSYSSYLNSIAKPIASFSKKGRLMKYPTKSNLMDFYCSNKTTKSSKNMLSSSMALRINTTNFTNQNTILKRKELDRGLKNYTINFIPDLPDLPAAPAAPVAPAAVGAFLRAERVPIELDELDFILRRSQSM